MALRPFPTNRNYEESIRGLRLLHEMELAGTDQSEEADALRDRLERPWNSLPDVQRKRLEGLSEDLYSIWGAIAERLPPNPRSQRNLVSALEATHAGDWDKALELLRGCRQYLDPDVLSYLRGTIWFGAGDSATAALFFGHAAKLDPLDGTFVRLHLHALGWKSDRAAAAARAAEILCGREAIFRLRSYAAVADIRLMATRDMSDGRGEIHSNATCRFVRTFAIARLRGETIERNCWSTNRSRESLGFCFDHLGDDASALRWFDLGIEADPQRATRYLLPVGFYVTARIRTPPCADFEQAIASGSNIVWPFYFIAHYSLMSGRFWKTVSRNVRSRSLHSQARTRSLCAIICMKWLAISRAEFRLLC